MYVRNPKSSGLGQPSSIDIVRLLFMVPLYAIISFASFLFWVSQNSGRSSKINLSYILIYRIILPPPS